MDVWWPDYYLGSYTKINSTLICYRLVMAVTLTRDNALTVPLLSTYGTATLLGKDGRGVQVPLAPLLGASLLV